MSIISVVAWVLLSRDACLAACRDHPTVPVFQEAHASVADDWLHTYTTEKDEERRSPEASDLALTSHNLLLCRILIIYVLGFVINTNFTCK